MKSVVYLMGPTASGKTDLSIQLLKKIPCEIISVDSGMIYRRMDIGTAKPTSEQLAEAPHRLINIRSPAESYSAGEFRQDALREIEAILARGRIPLLVGGTMLYFRVLEEGISELPQANAEVRKKIIASAKHFGWQEMYHKLEHIDPQTAARISCNDSQRIQRALEVYELTGHTLTELWEKHKPQPFPYPTLKIGLIPPDKLWLQQRIQARLMEMLQRGFVGEVEALYNDANLCKELPSMRTVGYRQVWQYLEGTINYDEMLTQIITITRQLAKRQLTWLGNWPTLMRVNAADPSLLSKTLAAVEVFLSG